MRTNCREPLEHYVRSCGSTSAAPSCGSFPSSLRPTTRCGARDSYSTQSNRLPTTCRARALTQSPACVCAAERLLLLLSCSQARPLRLRLLWMFVLRRHWRSRQLSRVQRRCDRQEASQRWMLQRSARSRRRACVRASGLVRAQQAQVEATTRYEQQQRVREQHSPPGGVSSVVSREVDGDAELVKQMAVDVHPVLSL